MSEFDRQNEDVFQIVHNNPRRRGVCRTVGYIVPQEQAERFAVHEAADRLRGNHTGTIMMALAAMVMAAVTIVTLIG